MRKILFAIVAPLLCVACSKEVEPIRHPEGKIAVQIAPAVEQPQGVAQSRADQFTYFAEGAKVGLYMVSYSGSVPGTLGNTGNHADNQPFIAGSDNVLRITPPVFYPDVEEVSKVDIYAYYPYSTSMVDNVKACPFSVSDDQSVIANVSASDLCWAKNLRGSEAIGIVPSAKPVAMEFVHKHSKIAFGLTIPSISPSGKTVSKIENVKVNGVFRNVTLNLSDGSVAAKPNDVRATITPTTIQVGAPGGTEYKYEVIVPAQTFPVGYSLISFDIVYNDATRATLSYKVTDASFGASNVTLAGKLHKISLKLDTAWELTLTGSQITNWTTGVTQSGIVDNLVTTSFKVVLASAASVTTVNRVVMKLNNDEGTFDIKTGVTYDQTSGVCEFKFETGKAPRDYGYKITSLQFYNGTTAVTDEIVKNSARIYESGEVDLGTW